MGFEPMTPALRERCSGQLSYVGSRGASLAADGPSQEVSTRVARSFRERLIGLAFRRVPRVDALLIPRCRSVHTVGMRFPLDLFWIDSAGEVIRVDHGVRPWRARVCPGASGVIEAPSPANRRAA